MENYQSTLQETAIEPGDLKDNLFGQSNNVSVVPSESENKTCSSCSAKSSDPPTYVYAIGNIEPRFRSKGIEKEFAQAIGRKDTVGLTDRQALHKVLTEPQNRYLVRQLCWVFTIEGLETYILQPLNPVDLDMLVDSLRPSPKRSDIDVVIGILGPLAPAEYCNGLQVPVVGFTQVYSFDVDSLIKSIPKADKNSGKEFVTIAEELFMRIVQMADNAGTTDDARALNYLLVRYDAIYSTTAECNKKNFSLTGVEVKPSALSGTRKIVDVIFTYNNRTTDVMEKYFCRVDITEEFPFLVSKMQAYYNH
jgi:hypothetical protein